MTVEVSNPLALGAIYLWIGFVCAISFMEAWIKFRAPGISIPLGLGIGKLVFRALNRVELFLAAVVIISFVILRQHPFAPVNLTFFIPVALLMLQKLWLMPALGRRAEALINGASLPKTNHHFYYVMMELVKVSSLLVFSFRLFN